MLKIIDIQVSGTAAGEWVVLQNQGMTAVNLRGFVICGDNYLNGNAESAAKQMFIFTADESVKPGVRAVLLSTHGVDGWQPTIDGGSAYVAYANRAESLWSHADELHLLQPISTRRIHPGQILELVEREA